MSSEFVEHVSMSLVREFLKRKGLTATYQTLDDEAPKTECSITNRTELAKHLHIEKLLKRNKEHVDHLRTIIEVIARYLIERSPAGEPGLADHLSYQPPLPSRPKSRQTKTPSNSRYDSGLLIEDDLETELMAGRGMDDVIQHENVVEAAPPSHPRTHRSRKHRRTYYQHSLEEPSSDVAGELLGPSHLTAGGADEGAKETTCSVEQTTPSPDVVVPGTSSASPSPSPADMNSSNSGRSESSPSTVQTIKLSETANAQSAENQNGRLSPDSEISSAPTSNSNQNDADSIPVSSVVPKPPLKAPEYLHSAVKSDVEKSMELLRQRRLTQQRANQILLEINGCTDVTEASGELPAPCEARDTGSAGEATNGNSAVTDDSSLEHPETEESYSPRIIYAPVECAEVVTDVSLLGVKKTEEKAPEETLNKQPVSFMAVKEVISTAKSIDIQTAMELKRLVLGSSSQTFCEDWLCQGLGFCDLPGLLYGIVQHQAGTCGVLAVVQAYFMMELLFTSELTKDMTGKRKLSPHSQLRSRLLAGALSKLLWKCGEEKRAVLALPSDSTIISGGGRFKPDGITETLMINIVDNYEDVQKYTLRFLPYFEDDDSSGAILLLYSAVLSRGIEQVVDDMDSPDTSLITDHGFCSPELVNLFLCGKAASNVFNDCVELTQGLGKTILLKGIPTRCDIGFLSLLEHTNRRYKVGTFLKTPKFPVWVCLIDDHYSIAFCLNKDLINDWKAERRFDLVYYDTLCKRDSPVRLTIDTTSRFFEPPEDDGSVPPLELSLRTKWRDAQIDWNGTEPILSQAKPSLLDELLM